MVRLVGSEFVSEGRVEVYYNGQWGTVCRSGYEVTARTICEQLGYTLASFGTTSR